jgi:hypothetical protein
VLEEVGTGTSMLLTEGIQRNLHKKRRSFEGDFFIRSVQYFERAFSTEKPLRIHSQSAKQS